MLINFGEKPVSDKKEIVIIKEVPESKSKLNHHKHEKHVEECSGIQNLLDYYEMQKFDESMHVGCNILELKLEKCLSNGHADML
jgi:hypothetical protein